MNMDKWKRIAGLSNIVAYSFFFLLILIAMIFYTGGTMDNPSAPGYSFWGNTISDLGRIVSYNGSFNIVSMVLFTIGIALLAFLPLPLYIVLPKLFSNGAIESISAKIGSLLGFITTVGWIGIIFTPADIFHELHWLFAYLIYIAFFFNGVFYTVSLFFNDDISRIYALIFTIYCVVHFIALMIIIIGMPMGRTYLVVGQKIAHVSSTISYIVLGYGILTHKSN